MSSVSVKARKKSEEVFRIQKSLLSIAPGEIVQFPIRIDISNYSAFHVHHLNNASAEANIYWLSDVVGDIAFEKTIVIPATGPGNIGRIISSSVKSRFLDITITNTDIVPLTDIYVSVFGVV